MEYIYRINTAICVILGISFNSILAYFILKVADKNKRNHSKILLLTCSLDVICLIMFAIIQPAVFTKQGNVLMLQMGPFKKSSPMTVSIGLSLWVFLIVFSVHSLLVQLVYKYLTICSALRVTHTIFLLMLCFPTLFSLLPVILICLAISPNETKLAELTSLVSSDDYTLSYFTKGTSPLLSYINFFFIATFLFTFTGIIWCSYKILTFFKCSANSLGQKRYRELNIQITRALIAQMFVPCILTLAPLSFYVFASEQKFNLKHSSFFMNLPINWSPVINPLSTILIIKQYRRSLLNFKKIVKKSHVTAVEARLGPH